MNWFNQQLLHIIHPVSLIGGGSYGSILQDCPVLLFFAAVLSTKIVLLILLLLELGVSFSILKYISSSW